MGGGAPFQPSGPGSGNLANNALTPPLGQRDPSMQVLVQALVAAIWRLVKATKANSGGSSGEAQPWTPSDGSGAGLSFTNVNAAYTRIGNIVHAYATLTYPSTSDGNAAFIAGLPISVPNQSYAQGPALIYCVSPAIGVCGPLILRPVIGTTSAEIANLIGGGAMTNANLTTLTLSFLLVYPAL